MSITAVQVHGVSELIVRELRLRPYGNAQITVLRRTVAQRVAGVEQPVPRLEPRRRPAVSPCAVSGRGLEAAR